MPAPLELEPDGGSNGPTIMDNNTRPTLGEALSKYFTASGGTPDETLFSIGVFDPDSSQVYVRLFLDGYPYKKSVASEFASGCTKAAGCSVNIVVYGVCDNASNTDRYHYVEAFVVDQEWDDSDKNNLRYPIAGGFTTSVSWQLLCDVSPATPDAGL